VVEVADDQGYSGGGEQKQPPTALWVSRWKLGKRPANRLGTPFTAGTHADEVWKLHRAGLSKLEIARRLQIGRASVRRFLT